MQPPPTPTACLTVHEFRKQEHVVITFAAREGFADHAVCEWWSARPQRPRFFKQSMLAAKAIAIVAVREGHAITQIGLFATR